MAQAPALPASSDTLVAVRNALKLGGSLVVTLAMSFGVRLLLPRYLGPQLFGPLNFADAYTTAFFVVVGLGVDTYVRREVPIRPDHAVEFFGGVLLARLGLSVLVFAAMAWVMRAGHRTWEVRQLVYAFGAAQLLMTTNLSLAALLHARDRVDGLSVTNVLSKALWGVLIILSLVFHVGLLGIPLALVLSELVKCAVLVTLVRKHLGWEFRLDARATLAVVLASLPFYLNTVAHTVYNKLDVSMLAFMSSNDAEVGRYGAAFNLAGITLVITPLIGWVLLPLYSKASHRSDAEFNQMLRRSLEFILVVSFPISLMTGLGADFWIKLAFGPAYASAATALQILAPLFLITYVATVSATCLINLKREWTLTLISLGGLVLNPLLNYFLIRWGLHLLGERGGGVACAVANVGTEVAVTAVMMVLVGRRAFDRRSLGVVAKTLGVCAAVILADRAMLRFGPARLILDAALYSAGVLLCRAVRLDEMLDFVRSALQRRRHVELTPLNGES